MQKRGDNLDAALHADGAVTAGDGKCADGPVPEAPAGGALTLHDQEVRDRLDSVFADHLRVARRCTFRVRLNHLVKRIFDVTLLIAGSVVAVPLIALGAVATLLDTGRPVFYVQSRRVRFGRIATIYKMRTLAVGSDRNLDALVSVKHHGKFLNITKDCSRYTRVGRWLERLWIVELPQILNIARGEMSVVGNRPIPDYVINALGPSAEVIERFASPQGLTGYVQCIGRDVVTDEQRILLEYHYSDVFERGDVFLEDLKIILHTLAAYLGKTITVEHFLGSDYKVRYRSFLSDVAGEANGLRAVPRVPKAERLTCPRCDAESESGDKIRLDASGRCRGCEVTYEDHDGVMDLFPRDVEADKTRYVDFYENDYLDENPLMHLEDTEWKVRELSPLLRHTNGSTRSILDVGCGAGELVTRIGDALGSDDRTAVDCSGSILRFAQKRHPELTFRRVDAAYLPFRNGAFDLSMLIDVVEHQPQPERVLRELSRVSKRLLFRTPLEDCLYEGLRRRRRDRFHESSGHVVHFDRASVRKMLESNGFSIREERIEHIAWSHWKGVLTGDAPLTGKITALGRYLLRFVLPMAVYRRFFVVNYNAICESEHHRAGGATSRRGVN